MGPAPNDLPALGAIAPLRADFASPSAVGSRAAESVPVLVERKALWARRGAMAP
eukprot:CAMPEP_0171087844 /NCGR_PEP_ID=MMETSP0766_2-20121228/20405_1 /TAXON_ID=439317 /ORGANISM="Gambierdiscus australes, Strain CAWD 149" /LENGTH=53 /DNA_ID=CAMNT_0011545575 /DNA_START=161 /DNA_END=320 /DNA_ORIENTATION=-